LVFYAVVSDEIHQVIEFFPSRVEAEAMLARVVGEEPDWRDTLHVEPIDLATGGPN
jgi:hypothetical protein